MKRIVALLILATVSGGCMSLGLGTGSDTAPWAKGGPRLDDGRKLDGKKAEDKINEKLPLVTAESVTEDNYQKIVQALDAELKHDANNPPKVVVEARK